jgi:hypothetical protein
VLLDINPTYTNAGINTLAFWEGCC